MNSNARRDDFDSLMADWFDGDAQVRPPEQLLAATLERTNRMRPLPTWRLPERWLPLATLAIRRPAVPRGAYLLVVVALLALAIAAALLLGVGTHKLPPPLGLAANGRIAYIAGGQIYTSTSGGTDIRQLTTGPSLKTSPVFSNDGTKLAYRATVSTTDPFAYADLFVADADGTHARVLVAKARGMGNPAWSPDGSTIAISTFGTGAGATDRLALVAVDSATDAGLVDLGEGMAPSWSPDGKLLAVARGTELWIVSRDGTTSRRISQGTYSTSLGELGAAAVWSPDGTHLLFGAGDPENVFPLYIVGLDGAPERMVAQDGGDAVWSPDGSMIAYMQNGTGTGPSLVLADSTGKKIRVFDGQYAWRMPIWSPDGTKVAILDDRPGPNNDRVSEPPVLVIHDVVGDAAPVIIPGVIVSDTDVAIPDFSGTWQRLAP